MWGSSSFNWHEVELLIFKTNYRSRRCMFISQNIRSKEPYRNIKIRSEFGELADDFLAGIWRDRISKECVLTLLYLFPPRYTSGATKEVNVTVLFSDYKSCFISSNPNSSPCKHLKNWHLLILRRVTRRDWIFRNMHVFFISPHSWLFSLWWRFMSSELFQEVFYGAYNYFFNVLPWINLFYPKCLFHLQPFKICSSEAFFSFRCRTWSR